MTMNWRAIRAIVRKDLKQVVANKMIWLPMIIVPLILQVVMPLIMILMPTWVGAEEFSNEDFSELLVILPEHFRADLIGLDGIQQWIFMSANYMFAPLFLVVPMMVSSILGSDSFAGEKERKTLEGLLYTPLTDTELFLAKLLTSLVPALVITFGSFLLYGVVVNLAGYHAMGRIYFPTAIWWPLVFWVGPAASVAGLGATVLISSKAKSFVQTQQLSGTLVLPVVFLMIGQISGLFFLGPMLLIGMGFGVWLVGIWLVWIGAKTFSRGELVVRL